MIRMALYKVLLAATETPIGSPSTVLLVTAHPDDETLFFLPTIQGLQAVGARIAILCLSCGRSTQKLCFA